VGSFRDRLEIHADAAKSDRYNSDSGARLRWAAGAGEQPTATEGGDPMSTSNVGSVATLSAVVGEVRR
jgi:hypothetical protein